MLVTKGPVSLRRRSSAPPQPPQDCRVELKEESLNLQGCVSDPARATMHRISHATHTLPQPLPLTANENLNWLLKKFPLSICHIITFSHQASMKVKQLHFYYACWFRNLQARLGLAGKQRVLVK